MSVITISREFGSGGSEVARLVADALGWTVIDNEFVDRVADRAGVSAEEIEQQEERVPTLIERLARALTVSAPEMFAAASDPQVALPPEDRIVHVTEAVIMEAVQQDHVVLVGRGAQAYLAEREGTLHAYVVAPREQRVRAVIDRLALPGDEAERKIDEVDEGRRRYVHTHYGRRWDDPANYDMVVNTGRFSCAQAAALIVTAARTCGLSKAGS